MPLGAKVKSKKLWEPVIERCRKRLAEWKTKYLSAGARIILIKSVLSSLPTYYFSLFPTPISVIHELESLQRNFLWGRREGVFKHNLVEWKAVCKNLHSGGIGIRKLKLHNEALMGKWLWRFAHENSSLWRRLIVSKYGEEKGGWVSAVGSSQFGTSLWKYIRRNWDMFTRCVSWKVGRGERTMFWNHKWLEVGCLAAVFSDLYAIASDKEALISDYSSGFGSSRVWNIQLRRHLNDWEVESLRSLLALLHSLRLEATEDALLWKPSSKNLFTVKSFYFTLQGEEMDSFPWRNLWKTTAPTKISFFSWCAARGRILTLDNLKLRGYSIANRCSLCLSHEESIDHLLLHCSWSADLWYLSLSCFGVQMCFPNNLKNFLVSWWGQPLGKRRKKIWNLIPFCLFWLVWKERNRRTFESIERSILRIKSVFLSCLYSWVEEGKEIDCCSFMHFVDRLQ